MNKLLASLLMIGLVVGMAGAGTWAYFSDTEKSTANTFTSGVIDLQVNGADLVGNEDLVALTDLKPSFVQYVAKKIVVVTNPSDLFLEISNPVTTDVTTTDAEAEAEGETPVKDLQSVTYFDIRIYKDLQEVPSKPTNLETPGGNYYLIHTAIHDEEVTIKTLDIGGGTNSYWIDVNNAAINDLEPGTTYWVIQSFHMDKDAGNKHQADMLTFTETFMAQQTNAPAPLPMYSNT